MHTISADNKEIFLAVYNWSTSWGELFLEVFKMVHNWGISISYFSSQNIIEGFINIQ